jgi:alpha-L-rhamnosidase
VGEWIWRHVAGLNPDEQRPGWKHFFVAPKPGGGVTWAKGEFDSIYGEIESSWRLDGNRFVLSLVIPVNTTATVVIPATKAAGITENGRPMDQADGVRLLRFEKNRAVFEVESGRYQFASMVTTGP